jgi:hypothetical protein
MDNLADRYALYLKRKFHDLSFQSMNSSASEYANDRLTRLSLKLLIERKHPLLHESVPPPLPTDIKEGWVFSGTTGLSMELHSIASGFEGREFISTVEAKRLGIDHLVRDPVNISLHDKYRARTAEETKLFSGNSTAEYVNIDLFSRNKNIMQQYFPDHESHVERWKNYTQDKLSSFITNKKHPDFNNVIEQSNLESRNSLLPKYSLSLKQYEMCRILGKKYTPRYSPEEILKEVSVAFQNHPREARRAFQKCSYYAERFINKVFSREMVAGQETIRTTEHGLSMPADTRRSAYIDHSKDRKAQEYDKLMLGRNKRQFSISNERSRMYG